MRSFAVNRPEREADGVQPKPYMHTCLEFHYVTLSSAARPCQVCMQILSSIGFHQVAVTLKCALEASDAAVAQPAQDLGKLEGATYCLQQHAVDKLNM